MTRVTWQLGMVAVFCGTLGACLPFPKGPPCTQYWDQRSPGTVRFILDNQSGGPLFFRTGCGDTPRPELRRADGTLVPLAAEHESAGAPGDCAITCQDKQSNPAVCMFAASICQDGFFRLNAGATTTVSWERLEFRTRDMPEICWAASAEESCTQVAATDYGTYTLTATAFTTCEAGSAAQCECAAGQQTCMLDGSAHQTEGSATNAASATVNVPRDGEVRVVFN